MCVSPVRLPITGELVACRGCWQCQSNQQYDWVGRCIAEAHYSNHVRFMTFTYAGDTPAAVVFVKKHVQRMLYRLRTDGRRQGWKVRYILTGEIGDKKGRVHWHAILFFVGKCPDMELTRYGKGHMFQWKYWPHGVTVAKIADQKSFRYVVKYIRKDVNKDIHGNLGYFNSPPIMSKKPPIGDQFVSDLARDMVDQGLPLLSPEYSFAGVIEFKSRLHRRFWLQGKSRENLMARYVDLWRERYGTEPPWSEYFWENHFDPIARKEMDADAEGFERAIEAKRPRIDPAKLRNEDFAADGHDPFQAVRRRLGLLMIRHGDTPGSVELSSDGSAVLDMGDGTEKIISKAGYQDLAAQLVRAGLRPRNVRKVCRWLCRHWQITVPDDVPDRLAA